MHRRLNTEYWMYTMKPKKTYLLLVTTILLMATLACRAIFPETSPTESAQPQQQVQTENQEAGIKKSSEGDEEEYFEMPTFSGEEQTLDSEHFRIHYTLSGNDAVSSLEYVNTVAEIMEHVWQVEVEQMGWTPPPPDGGFGGDDRYDVYLLNIFEDGTAGYSDGGFPETVVGDNPRTPFVETRSHYSYLALDNDYIELYEYGDGSVTTLEFMKSTAAHEFNHALQFAYDGEEPAEWLWEATATWVQSQVYPQIHDADEELVSVFKSPDTCQLAYGGETRVEDENHWYGLWIFMQYISENYGPETVRSIWEHARELDGYEPLEVALFDAGTTLDETFRGFSLALLTRGFERGSEYPTLRLEGVAAPGETFTPNDGVGQMAADYLQIQAEVPVTIRLETESLHGMLVGLRDGNTSLFPMDDNQASVDAGQFDHIYLIVINPSRAETEFDCQFTTYNVRVDLISQSTSLPIPNTHPAPNFEPPQVEELLDPEEYWDE